MTLVGRDAELIVLERELRRARDRHGAFVLLSGEMGIGKTRLADEIARRAGGELLVAWGRSWEGEGTPAYWPFLQLLRVLRAETPAAFDEAMAASDELAALLSARKVATPVDPEQARFRLYDAVARLLRVVSESKPLLLVLDDLHAADQASLALLRFVARDLHGSRIAIVATARDSSDAPEAFAKVSREATIVPLGRLSREALKEWATSIGQEKSADAVFDRSEGNPLFANELLAAASKQPGGKQTPLGVREAIRAHLEIARDSAALLEAASVIGRDFTCDLLTRLTGVHDARAALSSAVDAGIVIDLGEGQMRFAHILVRDELYAKTGARRAELHRKLADLAQDTAEIASHALAGSRPEDAPRTIERVLAAMQDASSRLAFADAATLGGRALATLSPHVPPAATTKLRFAMAEAMTFAGDRDLDVLESLAELAEASGDGEIVARVALLAAIELTMNRDDRVVGLLRRAHRALPPQDSPLRAEVTARLAIGMMPPLPHEIEESFELAREALAMARRLDDEKTLFAVLRLQSIVFPERIEPAERIKVLTESIALAKRVGRVAHAVQFIPHAVASLIELGDIDAALEEAARGEELVARLPQAHYQWRLVLLRAMLATIAGRFDEADEENRVAFEMTRASDLREGMTMCCLGAMGTALTRGTAGRYAELDELTTRLMAHNPLQSMFKAMPDAIMGRTADVREALDKARRADPAKIPGFYALAIAGLHAGVNDHAAFFYDTIAERWRDQMAFGPGSLLTTGPNELLLGKLAAVLDRRDVAAAHFERALAYARRIRAVPYIAQAEAGLEALGHARAKPANAQRATVTLEREGVTWTLRTPSARTVVQDGKGVQYLDALVREPHREVHVLSLVGAEDSGDAGPHLDDQAKRAYRERAESLRETLEEATANGDLGRAERARDELDALAAELSRAVGLGNRDRRAASQAERARINVQRRIRDAIRRVREQNEEIGKHLEASVKTGLFCVYAPTWPD